MTVTVPHLSLPFRIVGAAAAVTEQDTLEEITGCVTAILLTPQGSRPELPGFGVPELAFTKAGVDITAPIVAAVQEWEPRAAAQAEALNESLTGFVTGVAVAVQGAPV